MSLLKANAVQLGQSLTASQNFTWYQPAAPDGTVRLGNGNSGSVTDLVTLTSAGNLGIGTSSPGSKLEVNGNQIINYSGQSQSLLTVGGGSTSAAMNFRGSTGSAYAWQISSNSFVGSALEFTRSTSVGGTTFSTPSMLLDSSGNLGLGVTPSAWRTDVSFKALQLPGGSFTAYMAGGVDQTPGIAANGYVDSGGTWRYINSRAASWYIQNGGMHAWYTAPSGTAGNTISFTQAMTLDASGWLNVGNTGTNNHSFWGALNEGSRLLNIATSNYGGQNAFAVYSVTAESGINAAATATRISKNSSTSRSVNAAGTLNASGADYAEYMTKAGDFEIAKGDVCGVDANGLLTNIFPDAVSFVVKSTDPSFVGNDVWGAEIEDKETLEAERQKVDRIAFAGQVPVNVFGAKAGDYIIPVVDADGIKGEAISNPTFEQYQIAVGKVIAIETDGRAKIIVKVT